MSDQVESYFIEKVSQEFQPLCLLLHDLILDIHPEITSALKWQIPAYDINGLCIGVGAFKKKTTIFFHRGAEMQDFDQLFRGQENNKCMRSISIVSIDNADFEQIEKYLREAIRVNLEVPPAKKTATPIPLPPIPKELSKLLDKHLKAKTYFNSLTKTNKREFINWINSAKLEETKNRRALLSIEKLNAGLTCNHKYKNNF